MYQIYYCDCGGEFGYRSPHEFRSKDYKHHKSKKHKKYLISKKPDHIKCINCGKVINNDKALRLMCPDCIKNIIDDK